jgi:CheY-like chemotaxis protein/anti-sigma regulatory factor (Ser/Thr protein kinase)
VHLQQNIQTQFRRCLGQLAHLVIRQSCQEKGLELTVDIEADAPQWVRGDERRLQQVLMNLMSNAVKFTDHGSVGVTLGRAGGEQDDQACRFTVSDTGIGIAETDHEPIFRQFTQADGSLARPYEGAGLGLYIAREIVSAMGGRIEVESVVGQGSTFSLIIPFAEADSPPAQAAVPEPKEGQPWPLQVLLVDDAELNREMAQAMLEELGTEVTVATTGEQALALWEETRPDLILMDIQMPVMDGLEATQIIRQRERSTQAPRVPIIVLTGHGTTEQKQQCLEAGASDCLFKPFGFEDLREAIRPFADQGKEPVPGH